MTRAVISPRVRPLGTAAFVNRPDVAQLLLAAGADPSLAPEEHARGS